MTQINRKLKVPFLAHLFFKWYCRNSMYEEIHGDLEEFFYERAAEKGLFRARLFYYYNVIRCCQPYLWGTPKGINNSSISMFNNYLKTSIRSMIRNPLTSFINLFGLAIAVGICMVVYAFLQNDINIDRHHEHKDHVFHVTIDVDRGNGIEAYGKTPLPLGQMLVDDFSQVKAMSRVHDGGAVIKYEDNVFHERVRFADASFLEMMTFPLSSGVKTSLADPNSIILSHDAAIKYFGDEDPLGKTVSVNFNGGGRKSFTVTGVAEKFPVSHIIEFSFLVNFENLSVAAPTIDFQDWRQMVNGTLIQLDDPAKITTVQNQMEKYKELKNAVDKNWEIRDFGFVTIHNLHLASKQIVDDLSYDSSEEGRIVLPIVAIFMILLACFNYMNISIVSAAARLKEIGLRKVIGASRRLTMIQFLTENILITLIAGGIGLILGYAIFLPWFVRLTEMQLSLNLASGDLWIFLGLVLLGTGLLSGIYPALYISRFEVVQIFKGKLKFGKKNRLTKVFLTLQLVFVCVGITGAVMFAQNSAYQAERSWGYNQQNTLYINVGDKEKYDQLKNELSGNKEVLAIAAAQHHLGTSYDKTMIQFPDKQYEVREISVGPSYVETMGLQLAAGRTFAQHRTGDANKVMVTKHFTEYFKMSQPLGEVFKINEQRYEIIGVLEDFHFFNFYYETEPTMLTLSSADEYQYLALQVNAGSEVAAFDMVQSTWTELFPEEPFDAGYQDLIWKGFYRDLIIQKRFTTAIAIILVILASLGLYGLIRLNLAGRVREFSIRKVLGASAKSISKNIIRQYAPLAAIAIVMGGPLSHVLVKANLDMMYPDPRPFGYTGVTIAVIILIFVLLAVVATQIRRVVRANPVDGLNVE